MKNIGSLLLILISAFWFGCDEEVVFNIEGEYPSVIESFEPTSGSSGDEITIKGENLRTVNFVTIGDSIVNIKYRISSNEMVVKLDKGTVSGVITVVNESGNASSSTDEFTVIHKVPVISDFGNVTVLPNSQFKIEGENLDVVYDVFVGSSKANIVEANEDFFLIEVPFFEEEEEPAKVFFSYNDDGTITQVGSNGVLSLYRIVPSFSAIPEEGVTGSDIVFEGENLSLIDKMWFNDQEGAFVVNESGDKLTVMLTDDQFAVSTSDVTVKATYFGETQELILSESFEVIVPQVKYYSNIELHTRGGEGQFFLDFNTGLVYDACTSWDILQANISLLFYASKSGYVQLRQSGNASGVIKNYACSSTGEKLPSANAAKVSKFAVLDESDPAQKAYIDMVKNKTLTEIDPEVVGDFGASKSDLDIYTPGSDKEDEFSAGDVIIVKQTWNDEVQYGFIEIVDAYADIAENIGQASGDGSYVKFNYYFQK